MLENNQKEIILLKDLGMLYPKADSKQKRRFGLYKCFCGNEFKSQTYSINSFKNKSCGCLNKSIIYHGLSSHRLYSIWLGMIYRCNNINHKFYKDYGARGITVCERWLDINNFIEDMYPTFQEGLTLDRIKNDKGYTPDNCRWANKSTQSQNTRKLHIHNTSGFRGVSKKTKKWESYIKVNNKKLHLGYFENKIDAAKAYDSYVIQNNLEHTKNFE